MPKVILNTWLLSKAAVLTKYAEKLPHKLDRVTLKLDQPEAGWIGMHIMKNEEEVGIIDFSDVYDTLPAFIQWIEQQTMIGDYREVASSVNMDCEDVFHVWDYLPLWFFDGKPDNSWGRTPGTCGILTWYNANKRQMMLDAYCNRYLLIKDLYEAITTFAKVSHDNPSFAEQWNCRKYAVGNEDYAEKELVDMFFKSLTSEKIEKFLQKSWLKI